MMGYRELIIEATRCPEEDARHVEALMREQYRTLDHLDRRTFVREAKAAYTELKIERATEGVGLAFFAKAPFKTWVLEIEYDAKNFPTELVGALAAAGWKKEFARQMLVQLNPERHRVHLGALGTGPCSLWTDEEAKTFMAAARKVLHRYGYTRVPKNRVTQVG